MYRLNRTISIGKEKVLYGVSPEDPLGEYSFVTGHGDSFSAAIKDFLSQLPEEIYIPHGEDWDDPHEYISARDYELEGIISVYFGEYLSFTFYEETL